MLYVTNNFSPPEASKIRWVVTVPAIWSDRAKQFMRLASYKVCVSIPTELISKHAAMFQAGVGSEKHPEQLIIALEPEAAGVYCAAQSQNQVLHSSTKTKSELQLAFEGGKEYLVLDCGGKSMESC
jgi:hypothetical protein